MRVLIQRVNSGKVYINDKELVGSINKGYVLLVGFTQDDNKDVAMKMANKMMNLRIFTDCDDKLNLSLLDIGGEILSVSQFTLYADCKKGRRPSFAKSLGSNDAKPLYEHFNHYLADCGLKVETGKFGENMKVEIVNDGPVTILLDSDEIL